MAISNLSSGLRPGVCTSTTRPTTPYEGQQIYETDTNEILIYNGSDWVCLTPKNSEVLTLQTTTSTSYTDLTTSGPSVNIQTGAKALVTIDVTADSSTGTLGQYLSIASVAVSGATTISASDDYRVVNRAGSALVSVSRTILFSSLTGGVNTFTLKYRVDGGTGRFMHRNITVVGIP